MEWGPRGIRENAKEEMNGIGCEGGGGKEWGKREAPVLTVSACVGTPCAWIA